MITNMEFPDEIFQFFRYLDDMVEIEISVLYCVKPIIMAVVLIYLLYDVISSIISHCTKASAQDDTKVMDHDYVCPVCMQPKSIILNEGGSFYALQCGHLYCEECTDAIYKELNKKCPFCFRVSDRKFARKIFL